MTRLRWLVATSLRGLWSRRVLSLGSLLLTVIAIASAVVGPSYQGTAANSFVISQLRAQPVVATALTWDYHPQEGQTIDAAIVHALQRSAQLSGPAYLPGRAIAWDLLPAVLLPGSGVPSAPRLLSVPGGCAHVALRGRCPTAPGEIAVLAADAQTYGAHLGSQLDPYSDGSPFTIVGIYRARAKDDAFWFGPGRLQTSPGHALPQQVPNRPAPWFTSQATIQLNANPWYVTVDQALAIPPRLTPTEAGATAAHVRSLIHDSEHNSLPGEDVGGVLQLEPGNALGPTVHRLLDRRGVARSTVTPAVLSLILVALVLLSRLLSAAMALRRGELALASLRGYSRRQLWVLGMLEPLLILVVAAPLGTLLGYLTSRRLATQWLVPGLPVPFEPVSGLAVIGVVLVTAAVAAVIVRDAVNEPLSSQIAGVRRPGRASRLLVLVRLALVAAAVAALVTAWSRSRPKAPDATDLALPMLLAIAAGLLSGLLVLALSGLWVRWTARRRAVAPYVASRTVRRRREGTLVILPLTAAMTIAVFAVGVSMASATWRASAAATEVGAPVSFRTALPLDRAVGLTHVIDPNGRWLMAAAVEYVSSDDPSAAIRARTVLDMPRLARVATWPTQWTPGLSAADVARTLGPSRPPVLLRGDRLSITVDNRVRGDYSTLGLSLAVLDDDGISREVNLGPYAHGSSTHSRTLARCATGCTLETIGFGGPVGLVEAMHGSATLSGFDVDRKAVPGALDGPWRIASSQVSTTDAVKQQPTLRDGHLTVTFGSRDSSSYAGISPTDVPAVVPVIWGRLATQVTTLPTGASGTFRVRSAGTSESMPFRGPSGMLMDYTMFARNTAQDNTTSDVAIWARADTPPKVLDRLSASGLSHADTQAAARHALDQDAFALALRLYVVVTVLVILLALAGLGANLAVQLPARRRDAASLRVVGVPRRSLMAGVVAEFLVVLGAAALAGVAAGALAQYVVVRTVTLGFADTEVTPRVLPSFDALTAVELSAVVLLVLLVLASAFAVLTVRGARTSSLRENAR